MYLSTIVQGWNVNSFLHISISVNLSRSRAMSSIMSNYVCILLNSRILSFVKRVEHSIYPNGSEFTKDLAKKDLPRPHFLEYITKHLRLISFGLQSSSIQV